jgi:hypothetical protein
MLLQHLGRLERFHIRFSHFDWLEADGANPNEETDAYLKKIADLSFSGLCYGPGPG